MPVHYRLRDREPLSVQRSDTRHFSNNPDTKFEIKVEDIVEKAVKQIPGLSAQGQKTLTEANVRPDIVVRDHRTGKAKLVIDAKNYEGTLPASQVDKLAEDMHFANASRGVIYVAAGAYVSSNTEDIAKKANIKIIRDGPTGKRALTQEISTAGGRKAGTNDERTQTVGKGPLKADGTPDMRFAANKTAYKGSENSPVRTSSSTSATGPLKADGTPDMRFAANKIAYKGSENSPVRTSSSTSAIGPLKADGTPDMRFAANKIAYKGSENSPVRTSSSTSATGPLKADGTPDMRYAGNKAAYGGCSSSSRCGNARGPLKKDGTPDRRYKANR